MQVVNSESVAGTSPEPIKFVVNEAGIVFFPMSQQHRDSQLPGVVYADEYRGNALAGIVHADRVEIRFHAGFALVRVRNLWQCVCRHVPALADRPTSYQNELLIFSADKS